MKRALYGDAAGSMELIRASYKRPGGGCGRASAPRRRSAMGPRPAALALLGLAAAAASALPLPPPDAGPHLNYGWGEPVRLRHLYTASKHGLFSCFLRIGADGRVDAAGSQSPQSECWGCGWGWGSVGAAGDTAVPSLSLCVFLCLPAGLLEIRAVAVRTVAIKGVQSSRYLCMDEAGRLHGQVRTALLPPPPRGIFPPLE